MKRGTNGSTGISSEQLAYIHGRIDKELEFVAASTIHCTATELAERLGHILLGAGIRTEHNMPPLLENSTTGGKTVATVEMVSGTHSDSQRPTMSLEARQRLSQIAKKRWASMSKTKKTRLLNKMARARIK